MITVNRYWVPNGTLVDQSGWHQDDNEVVLASEFDRLTAERDALQQRLNAADQRADDLAEMLALASVSVDYHAGMNGEDGEHLYDFLARIRATFQDHVEHPLGMVSKPPTYKPGLYAVRHIDNWDGERDVTLTFARLDASGKWTHEESGEALLVYRGDKVLRAWPLDCSDAPDTQIIGVPRDWLQEWALELVEAAQDGGQMSNQVEHLLEIHSKP